MPSVFSKVNLPVDGQVRSCARSELAQRRANWRWVTALAIAVAHDEAQLGTAVRVGMSQPGAEIPATTQRCLPVTCPQDRGRLRCAQDHPPGWTFRFCPRAHAGSWNQGPSCIHQEFISFYAVMHEAARSCCTVRRRKSKGGRVGPSNIGPDIRNPQFAIWAGAAES